MRGPESHTQDTGSLGAKLLGSAESGARYHGCCQGHWTAGGLGLMPLALLRPLTKGLPSAPELTWPRSRETPSVGEWLSRLQHCQVCFGGPSLAMLLLIQTTGKNPAAMKWAGPCQFFLCGNPESTSQTHTCSSEAPAQEPAPPPTTPCTGPALFLHPPPAGEHKGAREKQAAGQAQPGLYWS